MARPLRTIVDPDRPGLFEVTTRTLQSRFLLTPAEDLAETAVGILARAARRYGVRVHAFSVLSNHYHLLVTVEDIVDLSLFTGYVNSNLAREAGIVHGWRARLWARRFQAIPVSDEPRAQLGRLRYVLSQGAKEGLVRSPLEWPGAHCARALLDGTPVHGIWRDRTRECRARHSGKETAAGAFTEVETLELTPLPAMQDLTSTERRRVIEEMIHAIEHEAAADRAARGLGPPLGVSAVRAQNPKAAPHRTARRVAPALHADSPAAHESYRQAYRCFVATFRVAAECLRSGLDAAFPRQCFPPPWRPRARSPGATVRLAVA